MDGSSEKDTLKPGEIRFVDNFVPSLAAGDYTIDVVQTVQSLGGSNAYEVNQSFSETQDFTVRGPRFRIDPSDIYAMFPPPNSQGFFKYDLPHIMLNKRALPWERALFNDATVPWMALLLLDPSEILPPEVGPNDGKEAQNSSDMITLSAQELVAPKNPDKTTFYACKGRSIDESEKSQTCQVIDITTETFKAVMPSLQDLKVLTHCREVNLAQSGTEAAPEMWYAVVVGARFPGSPEIGQAGKLNVAHLVSLEGFEDYLNDPDKSKILEGIKRIRLVSLANWTFTCQPEGGENFRGLMMGLVANLDKTALDFRLPMKAPGVNAAPEENFAYNVIQAGYIPCSYQTRGGERTFAWYRGPFTPQPVLRFPPDRAPFMSSTQVMVYDQEHGLFDLSYAVAWETGRLLALSDQRFGVALLNWRRTAHRLVDQRSQRSSTSSDPTTASNSPTGIKAAEDAFMDDLFSRFATAIEPSLFKPGSQLPAEPAMTTVEDNLPGRGLAEMYQDEGVQQDLMQAGSEELDTICEWLAQLWLLNGVPFNNLVPDECLLPPESIRFFYLDRNWLEVMLEGALSIGVQSSRDIWHWDALHSFIHAKLFEWIPALKVSHGPPAGLILRSSVVSDWPGLEVRAYSASNGKSSSGKVDLLRMDRLSENVLFCLFAQVPAWIEFNEPKEGLHFGVEAAGGEECITLRTVSGDDVGKPAIQIAIPACDENRMLKISDLKQEIKKNLKLDEAYVLSPAEFALQMVKEPEKMVFQRK